MKKLGVLLLLSLVMLTACQSDKNSQDEKKEVSKMQIGVSFDSLVIERWQRDRDIFTSVAEKMGSSVFVQNAHGDSAEQKKQIEYFIDQKVDVIVVVAVDSQDLTEVVKKAKEKGIKVIAYDRLIENANVDLYISFDNKQVGTLMAQEMVGAFPNGGNIYVINGSPGDHNVKMVESGFNEVMKDSKINVVEKQYADNWLAEDAFKYISNYLSTGKSLDGIVCGNDDLASQAIRALSEHRLAGKVEVIGQDADLSACQRIVEGTQSMTVFKNVDELAKEAANAAVSIAKGQSYTVDETYNDGTYEVPYKRMMPVAVKKENMDNIIINSGFHLKEDVYLNVTK